ncbi:hypothetical protein C1646_672184 [Rhizophagus diaphanus]|nr:hypothetical protein C1646_672184 [Rhizophagus diaphanus] [Rhizophagus sp. MUCL 43196]
MEPHKPFKDYFKDELDNKNFVVSNIHIITIIPPLVPTGLLERCYFYLRVIQQFTLGRGKNRVCLLALLSFQLCVSWLLWLKLNKHFSSLKPLELHQQEGSIDTLWNGNITKIGIKKRFEYCNVDDKYFHPILVLSGGTELERVDFLMKSKACLGIVSMNLRENT